MGFLGWLRKAVAGAPAQPKVLVVTDLSVARTLPRRPAQHGKRRGEVSTCECGGRFEEVVFTTFGGDPATWRAWPLAVDGWRCARCPVTLLPRFLEADEAVAIGQASVEAANAGREAEAEYGFRRLVASWSGYRPALNDLTTLLLARAERLELEGSPSLVLLDEIEGLLRDALRVEPPPSRGHVVRLLAAAMLLREQSAQAEALVAAELEQATADERAELEQVASWVHSRGDLYDRGTALVRPALRLQGAAEPTLDAPARARAERGVRELLRHQEKRPESWQALWAAAMAQRTLGGAPSALELLGRAFAVSPGQDAVGREYVFELLREGQHHRAVELARATVEANPGQADLVSNLALAQVLAGQLDDAVTSAEQAVALDEQDAVSRNVLELARAVRSGSFPQPRSLAELEQHPRRGA